MVSASIAAPLPPASESGSTGWLLTSLGMTGVMGATVALLVRLFTLWLAVIIGLLFFLAFRRILFTGDTAESGPATLE